MFHNDSNGTIVGGCSSFRFPPAREYMMNLELSSSSSGGVGGGDGSYPFVRGDVNLGPSSPISFFGILLNACGKGMNKWTFLTPLILVSVLYYLYIYCTPFARKFNKFKGVPSLPIFGAAYLSANINYVQATFDNSFKWWKEDLGVFWLMWQPYFITKDVNIIEKVLGDVRHSQKAEVYHNSYFFMGHGIVVSPMEKWKNDRKLLLPSVKTSLYDTFLESFNRNSLILIDVLNSKFPTGTEKMDVMEHIGRCAMDIVFETVVDMPINIQKNPDLKFYEAYVKCSDLVREKTFRPYIKLPILWQLLGYAKLQRESMATIRRTFTEEIVKEKMAFWKKLQKEEEGSDFEDRPKKYSHLLYLAKNDPDDIFFHILTILAAGFETSSTSLNHTLFLLALNPDVMAKVQEEADSVIGSDIDRELTLDDANNLKYTELVLKEAMRFLTPAPLLGRTLGCDIPLENGLVMPKGANWMVPTHHVMHDPKIYPDPEKFIPERFTPENSKGRHPYAYLPFSAGPRGCFGMKYAMTEMKILLARMMLNFNVSTERRYEDLVLHYGIVLHIVGGLPVTLTRRVR